MFADPCYLGSCDIESIRALNDKLNARVVEQVNDTQELVMLNNFAHESNEYQFKRCLQDRMSDIASWRWVLKDLTKRLTDAAGALQHENNALRVVIERIQKEIDEHSRDASQPGALSPLSDSVEEAILEEYNFLRDQKKKFEGLVLALERQIKSIEDTKQKIETDIFKKERALSVEEGCAKITESKQCRDLCGRRLKKKKAFSVTRWENSCVRLKISGLRALRLAIITRQEIRGARVHLSIAAQAHASRVDSALRRRLNTNKVKLQDIYWQKEETWRDYQNLQEELTATEQNIYETLEQECVVEARLADRCMRPNGEQTKDEVDRKLRDELGRLRNFSKHLRDNHASISKLQNLVNDSLIRIDSCAADLLRVVRLDDERITLRLGEPSTAIPQPPPAPRNYAGPSQSQELPPTHVGTSVAVGQDKLQAIKEEDEKEAHDDDEPYPLPH